MSLTRLCLFSRVGLLRKFLSFKLDTAIRILKANDAIFAQAAARLHLDDFQGNVSGLIFSKERDLVFIRHLSRPLQHNPMLSAVAVLLQAQACAWFPFNALDLEALSHVNVSYQPQGRCTLRSKLT
jgi:hypothetical protein